ncbi:MAG TPA: alpha/beta hydrolase [Planctomycetota bacterium]
MRRLLLASALLLGAGCATTAARDPRAIRDGTARSADGVPIHYRAGGEGRVALVFVHGWLGNASWWEPVMAALAPRFRVVAVDLAGHGASGAGRADWSVAGFAGDVVAVVEALDLREVVLLGHSMSGAITVEAARHLGPRVRLLVPVDTLSDLDWDLPPEVWAQFFGGLRADFPRAVEEFFRGMLFRPSSPPEVVARVVAEARAAEPERAVRMLEGGKAYDLRAAVAELDVPIHALNSDLNETRLATNRRYARRFEVTVLPGVGHWPMLEDPAGFTRVLAGLLAAEGLR